jgi:hypothetical protein
MTRAMLICWTGIAACLAYMVLSGCSSCQYPPPGPQPATGGATATGGSPGTGGAATGGNEATGGMTASGGATEPAPSLEQVVCGHLQQLGCPEGDRPTCPDELWRINHEMDGRASIDLDCLLFSDTVAQVRACKSIACGGTQ